MVDILRLMGYQQQMLDNGPRLEKQADRDGRDTQNVDGLQVRQQHIQHRRINADGQNAYTTIPSKWQETPKGENADHLRNSNSRGPSTFLTTPDSTIFLWKLVSFLPRMAS